MVEKQNEGSNGGKNCELKQEKLSNPNNKNTEKNESNHRPFRVGTEDLTFDSLKS